MNVSIQKTKPGPAVTITECDMNVSIYKNV
jgi:hypothetical protein